MNRIIRLNDYSHDYKCDQLYIWFNKMFQMWEKDLDVKYYFICALINNKNVKQKREFQ